MDGFKQCAEWQKQKAVWLAWPWDQSLWEENISGAQKAVLALAKVIETGGAKVALVVPHAQAQKEASQRLNEIKISAEIVQIPFGDIWLRDIAPIFLRNSQGQTACACFRFNGWGEKYVLEGDAQLAHKIAQKTGYLTMRSDLILEGGAIETDGQGTGLTTKECLLHQNRNPNQSAENIEKILKDVLGIEHLIWLEKGLRFDHTDGHIDNIARFVAPGRVVCMEPAGTDDPQKEILLAISSQLKKAKDLKGQQLEVVTIPSPGKILGEDNEIMPASYLNFLISNDQVAVPVFKSKNDDLALQQLESIFAPRKVTGIDSRDLLTGGGSVHCISQPEFSSGVE